MTWNMVRILIETVAGALAAVGALGLAVGATEVGLILVGSALLITAGLVVRNLQVEPQESPLSSAAATRAVITASVALALSRIDPAGQVGWAILSAAILVIVLAAEGLLRRVARYTVPVVAHLSGLTRPRPAPNLGRQVVLASLAANAFGLLVAAAGGSSVWWLLAVLLAALPAGLIMWFGRRARQQAAHLGDQLPTAVARYAPKFVVYTSRPDDASYQVTMWLPYLKRTGLPFVIVTRAGEPAEALARLTDVPVVEARSLRALEAMVVPSLRAVFYVNASSGNGALVRYSQLRHIYLGHGDSDKPPSYNPTHAMYDAIFAAGPAAIRRYAEHGVRIPEEKFCIVGRPQVEEVRPASRPIEEVEHPTVLYAPTWRGHVEETMLHSLPVGETIVQALLARGANVIFRPHPFSYDFPADAEVVRRIQQLLAADARQSGRAHLWGAEAERDRSILDCINLADAMVSDVSSVVSDFLFSGKPLAMVAVPAEPDRFVAEYPIARAAYVIRGDLTNAESVLDQLLGTDPMAPQRGAVRTDYLGDFGVENYSAAFVQAVTAASTGPAKRAEAAEEEVGGKEPIGAAADPRRRLQAIGRLASKVAPSATAAMLALAALAASLASAPTAVWATLVGVTLALVALSGRMMLVAPHRAAARSGVAEPARALLIVTLGVVGASGGGLAGLGALVAVLAVALAFESHVQSAYAEYHAEVHDLPALASGGIKAPPTLLALGQVVTLALGFVLVAFDLPYWPLIVLMIGLVTLIAARTPLSAASIARVTGRLNDELRRFAPEFAVYFSSPVGAGYQVGMWLRYFARIGRPFIIVTRTAPMLNQIAQATRAADLRVPIILRPSLRSLEEVIVPSLKVAFYVNNAARNTHFVERRELTHVWLNHGDSEKPACYNPVHAIYDLIFAAGQAGIDRYARHGVHIPPEKFRIVGRPQVEQILLARGPIAAIDQPTVLYAPTWQGPYADSRVYSLPLGRQIVAEALRRQVRVIFRAHPFNYRYPDARAMIAEIGALLDADRDKSGREHLWGPAAEQEMSIEDCFNASDAMISDVSAVVSDYLHSGKPFAMVSIGTMPEELVVAAPAARAAYVLREDLSNLDSVFDDLLGADPLAAERHRTKIYYLGDFPDKNYADGFLDAAREVITGRNARLTT